MATGWWKCHYRLACYTIAVLLGFLIARPALAVLEIAPNQVHINAAPETSFLRDATGLLNWRDVLHSPDWQPVQQDIPSFGFDVAPYWLQLELANPQQLPVATVLEIDYPILDDVRAFILEGETIVAQFALGDTLPFRERPITHHNFVIPINLAAGTHYTLLLRIETETSLQVPLQLWQREAFFEQQATYLLGQGLYFGVILVMAVYNLFIYITVRHASYIYYALTALGIAGFLGSMHGLGFQYVWPLWPGVNSWITPVSLAVFVGGASAFTNSLLQLRRHSPAFYYAMLTFALFNLALIVLSGVIPYRVTIKAGVLVGIIASLTALAAGIHLLTKGVRTARYYVMAYSFLIFGGILLSFNKFGLVPRNFFTEYALQFCSVIEIVLLSFALADRINEEKRAKYAAQQLALNNEKKALLEQERYLQLKHSAQLEEFAAHQKIIEAKAESRAKSEFLATMSHEIRTPMNGMLGMAELLSDTPLNGVQQQYVNVITSSGKALLNIINDVLDFSKISAGKMTLEDTNINLRTLCQETMAVFYVMAERKQLQIQCILEPGTPDYIRADPTRLRQILLNLLGNAFKFTDRGRVTLRARSIDRQTDTPPAEPLLRFEVTDTGIGIEKAAQANLFQAFQQANSATHRQFGGTGLGLSISRHLSELMGGEIGVQSEPGRGSTFWFTIRYSSATPDFIEQQRSNNGLPNRNAELDVIMGPLTGKRILVAEDNAVNQLVIGGMLKKLGIAFEVVADGKAALTTLLKRHQDFDMVLMDCEMPIMNGYIATAEWRVYEQAQQLTPLPVIALTANVMPEHHERAREVGMNYHLSKPMELSQLKRMLLDYFSAAPTTVSG